MTDTDAEHFEEEQVTLVSTAWLIVIFVVVFVAIALLIVRLRINPMIALLLGTIALGITTGVSLDDLVTGINGGFGVIMAEVGLLISLGVIMGLLMSSYGAVQRIVEAILRLFGKRASPYAFALTLSTVTPSIYFDVLLVLVAPIARSVARRTGRPVASLAGPVAMGLAAGNALVIPGAAMLAYLGTVQLSAADLLLPGFAIAIPAVVITTFLYLLVIERFGWWNPARDEDHIADVLENGVTAVSSTGGASAVGVVDSAAPQPAPTTVATAVATDAVLPQSATRLPNLAAALAPVLVVLILILASIITPLTGLESQTVAFLGSPVIALLAGVLTALGITIAKSGLRAQETVVGQAFETMGSILVVTAVAGSLGAVIAATGLQDVLSELFGANQTVPLLAVWFVAAVLRTAIGGQTVAGITAIGIIAPLIPDLGLSPILVVLAAGAGGCFGGQFSDNAFWMLRSLFGLSTRGTLKTYTLAQSMLSIVVLAIVLLVEIFV
ncbi:GntP family permease [Cryobacterium aureum]|uniref:GntP family permease n=1 Tax=Cryobacterium aureum TaxID=995037 RepID=UPI000CF53982|nr:SLC13 family permease [Cryobacterium aureum]